MKTEKIQGVVKSCVVAIVAAGVVAFSVTSAQAEKLIGVTSGSSPGGSDNDLVIFSSTQPGLILSEFNISGLFSGETIRGIDSWNGTVYGIGSQGHLYSFLNYETSGAATFVGTLGVALNGAAYGAENSPAGFHVTTELGQNLVVSRATGAVTQNGPAIAAPFAVDALAWRTATSTMFAIDSLANTVGTFNAGTGTYSALGGIGFDVARINGFDISDATGIAYLVSGATSSDTQANLYQVNLATGIATLVGAVGQPGDIALLRALTVVPEPGSVTLLIGGLGLLAMKLRRRS